MERVEIKLSQEEKIARAKEGYAALNAGDLEKSLEGFSENLVFHTPVFPQPIGKEALRAATKQILDTTDEYRLEPHDILANDDHIVALLVVRGRRGDQVLNERGVHVMHVDKEGKSPRCGQSQTRNRTSSCGAIASQRLGRPTRRTRSGSSYSRTWRRSTTMT